MVIATAKPSESGKFSFLRWTLLIIEDDRLEKFSVLARIDKACQTENRTYEMNETCVTATG